MIRVKATDVHTFEFFLFLKTYAGKILSKCGQSKCIL